jgi:hypothetical protein
MPRIGRFSKEDIDFVRANAQTTSYEDIAAKLDRTVESVKEIAEGKLGLNLDNKSKLLYNSKKDIENRPYWPQLQSQFTESELTLFVYHWGLLYQQFKEDITHSEELQIVELIKLEILSGRVLSDQKSIVESISALKTQVEDERDKPNPDLSMILNLERQVSGLYASQANLSKENRDLIQEKNTIYKHLKSTRSDRLKNVEDSKDSIVGWFRDAIDNRDRRIRMGRDMEKMRLAADKERERLGANYTYVDGDIDRPLLTPAIVEANNK